MESATSDVPTRSALAQGLRDIRALRRRYWLVSALGVPAIVALNGIFFALDIKSRWLQTASVLLLVAGWIWLSNRLAQRLSVAACPRCGEVYFARQWGPFELHGVFFGSCRSCGLRLRADKHPDRDV
jgi:hypothetical protein